MASTSQSREEQRHEGRGKCANRRAFSVLIFNLVLLLAAARLLARTVPAAGARPQAGTIPSTITATLTTVADVTVRQGAPDQNFGSESPLEIAYQQVDETTTRETAVLVRFDLSSLPVGAVIDAAHLRLFLSGAEGAGMVPIGAYLVTSSWEEAGVTWNTPLTAGTLGLSAPVDSGGGYKSWQVTAFAQAWLDDPYANHGLLLRGSTEVGAYRRFFQSREGAQMVPELALEYQVPTYTLSGRVYEGLVGDEAQPLQQVSLALYCAGGVDDPGLQVDTTLTDDRGWYGLIGEAGCNYYHIVESDPDGYLSSGATTVHGIVRGANQISYDGPLAGKILTGNKFWDLAAGGPSLYLPLVVYGADR